MQARGGDRARVDEAREREDDDAAAHDEVRRDLVAERQPRVGHERAGVHPVEREATGHQAEVEELQERVRPPAAVVFHLLDAREAPLAEALAERAAQAAADARGEEVVELADDAAAARAEAEHVEQEAHDDDQREREPHRQRRWWPRRRRHVAAGRIYSLAT